MTLPQSTIFNRVKAFVLENRQMSSSELQDAELSMPNVLPTGGRAFLTNLARDLGLTLSWDEYDEEDQNFVVLRFPEALEWSSDDRDSENDSQDGVGTTAAVDHVLKKYDKAKILVETAEGNFDLREELRLEQKVDDWKRAYYLVWDVSDSLGTSSDNLFRINSGYRTTTPARWIHWSSVMSRACSG
jgi:5'-3' exoribonuclease 1